MPNFNGAEAGRPAAPGPGASLGSTAALHTVVPKRKANALDEWLDARYSTNEEFGKLHEDFGKEVRELIADWSKSVRADEAGEENLIDFG